MTLKQVADETGFAVSYLSLLERDKVSISVDNLERLARFYGVRMVHLFQGAEETPLLIMRRERIAQLAGRVEAGHSIFTLLSSRTDAQLEPLLVVVGPGHGDPEFRTHEGDTLIYVIEGGLQILSEKGEEVILKAGDAVCYFGFPGRRIWNASETERAVVLLASAPPTNARDDVVDPHHRLLIQSEEGP
ncbi:MAG: helix-turn-helix domain-containing protein [Anaerolineae bacterium]|nr:helix-turn-helix domain-containing protein [Anaerolineae bacterium]